MIEVNGAANRTQERPHGRGHLDGMIQAAAEVGATNPAVGGFARCPAVIGDDGELIGQQLGEPLEVAAVAGCAGT